MMVNYLLAQASPAASPAVSPAASPAAAPAAAATNSVDLFSNGLKNFGFIVDTDDVPGAIDKLWKVVMGGSMYSIVCGLGLLIATFAIGFWCVKFYKTLQEGGVKPAANDLAIPIILVILLSNGGDNLRGMTVGTRDMMNSINRSVTGAVSGEVGLKNAIRTIATYGMVTDLLEQGFNNCRSQTDSSLIAECLEQNLITVETIKGYFPSIQSGNASYSEQAQADIDRWVQSAVNIQAQKKRLNSTDAMKNGVTEKVGLQEDSSGKAKAGVVSTDTKSLNIAAVTDFASSKGIRQAILSMRGAFIYILEVMMLVTGLVGPIFIALAMFPSGSKFLLNWGSSFISLGFCKICYSLISGLSALAMVYAGPDSVDMLVASLILGLFAPVLAFGIASGSGMSILNTIAYTGQTYGVNIGMSSYIPAAGNSNPESSSTSDQPR